MFINLINLGELYVNVSNHSEYLICWDMGKKNFNFEIISQSNFKNASDIKFSSMISNSEFKYVDLTFNPSGDQSNYYSTSKIDSADHSFADYHSSCNSSDANPLDKISAGKKINRFVNVYWPKSTFFSEARESPCRELQIPYYFIKQGKETALNLANLGSERTLQKVEVNIGGVTKEVIYSKYFVLRFLTD